MGDEKLGQNDVPNFTRSSDKDTMVIGPLTHSGLMFLAALPGREKLQDALSKLELDQKPNSSTLFLLEETSKPGTPASVLYIGGAGDDDIRVSNIVNLDTLSAIPRTPSLSIIPLTENGYMNQSTLTTWLDTREREKPIIINANGHASEYKETVSAKDFIQSDEFSALPPSQKGLLGIKLKETGIDNTYIQTRKRENDTLILLGTSPTSVTDALPDEANFTDSVSKSGITHFDKPIAGVPTKNLPSNNRAESLKSLDAQLAQMENAALITQAPEQHERGQLASPVLAFAKAAVGSSRNIT